MSDGAPEQVACPCGNGYAELKPEAVTEPVRPAGAGPPTRSRTIYYYRHAGCHVGGHVVVENGTVALRGGPLFEPGRYGMGETPAAEPAVATDGGVVQ